VQADITDYEVRAYDLNSATPSVPVLEKVAQDETLVLFNSLQTDAWWTRDGVGYNFRHTQQMRVSSATLTLTGTGSSGNYFDIPDYNGKTVRFQFGTGTDSPGLRYVTIGASANLSATNLRTEIQAAVALGTFGVEAPSAPAGGVLVIRQREVGAGGNTTIVKSGTDLTVTAQFAGGDGFAEEEGRTYRIEYRFNRTDSSVLWALTEVTVRPAVVSV
jgi:hypothetical protein